MDKFDAIREICNAIIADEDKDEAIRLVQAGRNCETVLRIVYNLQEFRISLHYFAVEQEHEDYNLMLRNEVEEHECEAQEMAMNYGL